MPVQWEPSPFVRATAGAFFWPSADSLTLRDTAATHHRLSLDSRDTSDVRVMRNLLTKMGAIQFVIIFLAILVGGAVVLLYALFAPSIFGGV